MKVFLDEIDVRLSMIIEEVTVPEHRARVFKLIAVTITEIQAFKLPSDLLDFIINFINTVSIQFNKNPHNKTYFQWGHSDNVAARINTTCFISYIFETGKRYLTTEGEYSGFEVKIAAKMFLQLKRALLDKEVCFIQKLIQF